MNRTDMILAIVAVSIIATAVVSGLLVASQTYTNSGSILTSIGVEVFEEQACINKVTTVNWGTYVPGQNKTNVVYIRNNGTAAEALSISFDKWYPDSVSTQVALGWNCTNHMLGHGSVVCAVIWLSVSPSATATPSFTFETTITGTEHV